VDAPLAGAAAGSGLELSAPSPNPARDASKLEFVVPAAATVELEIRDVAGRRVRTIFRGELGAGRHVREWDGRDAEGRPVAAGVYFAELRAGADTRTVKVTRTR
jgi:flagellar hook assembly protein FlgD